MSFTLLFDVAISAWFRVRQSDSVILPLGSQKEENTRVLAVTAATAAAEKPKVKLMIS